MQIKCVNALYLRISGHYSDLKFWTYLPKYLSKEEGDTIFSSLLQESEKFFPERKMHIYDKDVVLKRRSSVVCSLDNSNKIPYSSNTISIYDWSECDPVFQIKQKLDFL